MWFQRCCQSHVTSGRRVISNQRWNNVVYVIVEIYNFEQLQINIDINNVMQRWNNAFIFNVEFHDVDHRRNNVVNMTILEKLKREKKNFWASKERWVIWLNNTCFWLWSIKRTHGTYSVKINVVKYNVWYMKRIWI